MSRYTKSTYEYTKIRKNFGRQILFQAPPAQLLDSIDPDKKEQKLYALRNPVNRQVQATMPQSEHDSNTKETVTHEKGINHAEGGWPREVNHEHEEQTHRHRRRVKYDENYTRTVIGLAPMIQHYINQNNAVEMYQSYFSGMAPQEPIEKYNIRVANVFRDPLCRPVMSVVWTNEKKSKLAVCYNNKTYFAANPMTHQSHECHLWDINCQKEPVDILEPEKACWKLACSPVDPEILIGGLKNGTVNVFDIRESRKAVSNSSVYNSHRGPITGLLYIHSRTNTEFYTGSPDGQCLWWDLRKLSQPTDRLPISVRCPPGSEPSLDNAEGVSCLQLDRQMPTKFVCGTESGLVINGNRMGKTHSEILYAYWFAHCGPVRTVQRSVCTSRMFITCGDWSVRVWSEEVRTAPIIVTKPYSHQVSDVAWAPMRLSSYMAVCENGVFYYWDLLRKYSDAVATLQLSKYPLTRVTPHSDGEDIAIGDARGNVFLLQLSENMVVSGPRDKGLMSKTYERETKREHILDTRLKEIHLKKRQEEEEENNVKEPDILDEDEIIMMAEEEYFNKVKKELCNIEDIDASFI